MRSITQFKGLWACGNAEGDMEMSKFRIFLSASDLEDILIGLHIKLSKVTVLGVMPNSMIFSVSILKIDSGLLKCLILCLIRQ